MFPDDIDARRPSCIRLFADAAQPELDGREERHDADQRGQRPGGPCDRRLAGERPTQHRHADERGNCDSAKADHVRVAEGSADSENDPQQVRGQSRCEEVHAVADSDYGRLAAEKATLMSAGVRSVLPSIGRVEELSPDEATSGDVRGGVLKLERRDR